MQSTCRLHKTVGSVQQCRFSFTYIVASTIIYKGARSKNNLSEDLEKPLNSAAHPIGFCDNTESYSRLNRTPCSKLYDIHMKLANDVLLAVFHRQNPVKTTDIPPRRMSSSRTEVMCSKRQLQQRSPAAMARPARHRIRSQLCASPAATRHTLAQYPAQHARLYSIEPASRWRNENGPTRSPDPGAHTLPADDNP